MEKATGSSSVQPSDTVDRRPTYHEHLVLAVLIVLRGLQERSIVVAQAPSTREDSLLGKVRYRNIINVWHGGKKGCRDDGGPKGFELSCSASGSRNCRHEKTRTFPRPTYCTSVDARVSFLS